MLLTLPQLEFNGAVLLAYFLSHVFRYLSELSFIFTDVIGWCDSTIVLAWLNVPPPFFKVIEYRKVKRETCLLYGDTYQEISIVHM